MIKYMVDCDIFKSEAQALVNTINCYGRMGKGLALQFKQKFPAMNQKYEQECTAGLWHPGMICRYKLDDGRMIINAATKNHWVSDSRIDWIDMILERIVSKVNEWNITSIALPRLGCGNGNLLWTDVGPRMTQALSYLAVSVEIYIKEGDQTFYLEKDRAALLAFATKKRDESTYDMQLFAWNSVLDGIDYGLPPEDIVEVLDNLAYSDYQKNAYQEFLQFAHS